MLCINGLFVKIDCNYNILMATVFFLSKAAIHADDDQVAQNIQPELDNVSP